MAPSVRRHWAPLQRWAAEAALAGRKDAAAAPAAAAVGWKIGTVCAAASGAAEALTAGWAPEAALALLCAHLPALRFQQWVQPCLLHHDDAKSCLLPGCCEFRGHAAACGAYVAPHVVGADPEGQPPSGLHVVASTVEAPSGGTWPRTMLPCCIVETAAATCKGPLRPRFGGKPAPSSRAVALAGGGESADGDSCRFVAGA